MPKEKVPEIVLTEKVLQVNNSVYPLHTVVEVVSTNAIERINTSQYLRWGVLAIVVSTFAYLNPNFLSLDFTKNLSYTLWSVGGILTVGALWLGKGKNFYYLDINPGSNKYQRIIRTQNEDFAQETKEKIIEAIENYVVNVRFKHQDERNH